MQVNGATVITNSAHAVKRFQRGNRRNVEILFLYRGNDRMTIHRLETRNSARECAVFAERRSVDVAGNY